MSLKVPSLDDKKYAEIVEDARKRIPVYTKEWSDHNVHDPGITFLELLSWIAEMQIYHLDQITERHYLKYLKLLGFSPRHQRSARVYLTIGLPEGGEEGEGGEAKIIPPGEKLVTQGESGQELVFETSRGIAITRAGVRRVMTDYLTGMDDNTEANNTPGMYFLGFGAGAEDGSCMYIGFDNPPFPPGVDTLDIAVRLYEDDLPPVATHGDEEMDVTTSVKVVWQYCTDYGKWYDDGSWEDFDVEEDTTMMLNYGGVVVLKRPVEGGGDGENGRNGGSEGNEINGRFTSWLAVPGELFGYKQYWIRCRVVEGGYEIPPRIDSILTNTVMAVHKATVNGESLERLDDMDYDKKTGSGLPNQRFRFKNAPVIEADIAVDGIRWKEVTDLDGSGPGDRHYVLDRENGVITFGDGINGKIPGVGQEVRARRYSYGGGRTGNVMPGSRWVFKDQERFNGVSVANTLRADGGEEKESFKSALSRLKVDLRVPYRAVTLEDYQYIAVHTPGLRFGRAKAIVGTREISTGKTGVSECGEFPIVKVVVVPYSTQDRPEPSRGFIDTVYRHLERHRLLTDVIEVYGPKYVGIGVQMYVKVKPGYSQEGRIVEIERALKDFLHPLKGGKDGRGWPFGRTVYRSEIYEVIEKVDGVDCVSSVSLEIAGDAGRMDSEGNIEIDEDALVYSSRHQIMIVERDKGCRMGR